MTIGRVVRAIAFTASLLAAAVPAPAGAHGCGPEACVTHHDTIPGAVTSDEATLTVQRRR
jgi:hypothetical protein